jgi:hypothetical protein
MASRRSASFREEAFRALVISADLELGEDPVSYDDLLLKTDLLTTAYSKIFQGSPTSTSPSEMELVEWRSSIAGSDISRCTASE